MHQGLANEPKGTAYKLSVSWLLVDNSAYMDTVHYTATNKHRQEPTVPFNSALGELLNTHRKDTRESADKGSTVK